MPKKGDDNHSIFLILNSIKTTLEGVYDNSWCYYISSNNYNYGLL